MIILNLFPVIILSYQIYLLGKTFLDMFLQLQEISYFLDINFQIFVKVISFNFLTIKIINYNNTF